MPIHNFTRRAAKHRDRESKLQNRSAHAVDRLIVLAWVANIFTEPVDRLVDDLHAGNACDCLSGLHTRTFQKLIWRDLSEGALFALACRTGPCYFYKRFCAGCKRQSRLAVRSDWSSGEVRRREEPRSVCKICKSPPPARLLHVLHTEFLNPEDALVKNGPARIGGQAANAIVKHSRCNLDCGRCIIHERMPRQRRDVSAAEST